MRSMCVWLQGNPAFCVLVLWPILTAAVNLAWKDASVYADTHPRFSAFKKLVQKWGLSPRDTFPLIAKALGIAPPAPPSPPPSAGPYRDPADSGDFGRLTPGLIPPDPPSRMNFGVAIACVLIIAAPLIGSAFITGCGGAQTKSAGEIEVGAYTAEQALCVDEAETKADADACRQGVKIKYRAMWAVAEAGVAPLDTDGGK